MPKTETPEEITELEEEIERVERLAGIPVGRTLIMAAIESALGVVNAYRIATASKRMMGIALGAEDYCANLKTTRSKEGSELLLGASDHCGCGARCRDRRCGHGFSNLNDMDAFKDEVRFIKQLGFDGKSVINPRQINPVNEIFTPTAAEIDKAKRIIAALKEAEAKGSGVVSLNGKMIDKPVVLRAERTLELARAVHIVVD